MLKLLVKIVAVGEVQSYTSHSGEQKSVMEVMMSSGSDVFIASAFSNTTAQVFTEKPVEGALYWVDLSFNLGGNGQRKFQNIRIQNISPF